MKVKHWWFYFYLTPFFLIETAYAYHARATGPTILYAVATMASLFLGLYSFRARNQKTPAV